MIRRIAALLLASLGLSLPASASTFSVDFTDLWYNATESGWGVNMIQQGDTLFATLFVYGTDTNAAWFVAPNLGPGNSSPGVQIFTGTLYRTTGPYFGAIAFNPNTVGVTAVGTMTLTFDTVNTGVLSYNVDNVVVSKVVTRQKWRENPPTGRFFPAGLTAVSSSCSNTNANGPIYLSGLLSGTVNAAGNQVSMQLDYQSSSGLVTCLFNGAYKQDGRLGTVSGGTWNCRIGTTGLNSGTFTLHGVDVQVNGMQSQFIGQDEFCTYGGRFGGLRDVVTQ